MEGLLWFDNTPGRGLEERVLRAVEAHNRKFGRPANCVLVHPDECAEEFEVRSVRVAPRRELLRWHLLVGVCDAE